MEGAMMTDSENIEFGKGIKLAIFDVAGTTVMDNGLVIEAFVDAFQKIEGDESLERGIDIAERTMGERKIDVFRQIFQDEEKAQTAHSFFIQSYLIRVKRGEVVGLPGSELLFRELRDRGIRVALNTGFNREILDHIISALDWSSLIDDSIASSEVEHGRPAPDMIVELMRRCNQERSSEDAIGPDEIVVCGDTVADMHAALNAGVYRTVGVLSGIHSKEQLIEAGAEYVVQEIGDITTLEMWNSSTTR